MERLESALDLFFKYCDRYPRIEMGLIGFSGTLTDASRFHMRPLRNGTRLGHGTMQLGYPYVDVARAGLGPTVEFKPVPGVAPEVQMQEAYWQRIQEFFARRRFYLRLSRDPKLLPRYYNVPLPEKEDFPVEFATWPAIPAGLVLNPEGECPRGYLHWSAFVPEGTLEHDAIAAALTLGKMAREPRKLAANVIASLQDEVRKKVALVRV